MPKPSTISHLLMSLFLLVSLNYRPAVGCNSGYYFSSASCGTPTNPAGAIGDTWTIETDTSTNTVYISKTGDTTDGVYEATYTSASDTYYVFTYDSGGVITFSTSSAFFKNQYISSYVSFSGDSVTFSGGGGVYSESIATAAISSFQMTVTSAEGWVCFGIVETTSFNTGNEGFTDKSGPCVQTGGSITTNWNVNLICNGCSQCDPACSTCTGASNTQCSTCNSGYYSQPSSSTTCLNSCPTGYYPNTANSTCTQCNSACSTCTGASNTQCSTCNSGYYSQPSSSTTCLNSCPTGYYPNTANSTCTECNSACSTCTGASNTQCSTCNSGYYSQPSSSTTCLNSCPTGYYPNTANKACTQCSLACSTCTGASNTQCSTCNSGYYSQPSSSTTCLNSCPTGYSPDTANNVCTQCNSACSTCTGASNTQCSTCNSGYYSQPSSSTTCLNSCPTGYSPDTANNVCTQCNSACSTCTGASNTQCSTCNSGYYSQPSSSTTCLNSCPTGYYPNTANNTCTQCSLACSTCTGASNTQCSTCNSGYYSQPSSSTTCLNSCPTGYSPDTANNVCTQCNSACSTCTGASNTQCSTCNSGYYSQPSSSTTCLNSCPTGYSPDTANNVCTQCNSACSTCTGASNTQCSTCNSGYYSQPSSSTTCLNSCPTGYYPNTANSTCTQCNSACSTCTGASNTQCSTCNSGYYSQPSSSTTCLNSCPTGYYPNTANSTCTECNSACSTCTGASNTQCSTCNSGYYSQPSSSTTCLNSCPTGYYPNTANKACTQCDVSCSQCTGSENTQCPACNSGYYLQPSSTTCLNTCPSSRYFPDNSTNTCAQCDVSCFQCTGSEDTQCPACNSGYYLQPNSTTCLNTCPSSGYFADNSTNTCAQCDVACYQCTGSGDTQCPACNSGYYLQPNSTTCLNTCPSSGYFADNSTNTCAQCDVACYQCTGSEDTQCSACNTGYFLQPSSTTCLNSCPSTKYYPDTTNHVCSPCDVSCLTCTGPAYDQCPSCATGYFLQPSSTACNTTCPDGFYANSTYNTCPACDSTCKTCFSYTNTSCLTCYPTAYFYRNQCFTPHCPSHTFPINSNMTCSDCAYICKECNGPSNYNCTACDNGLFLYNSTCFYLCPQGTYGNLVTSTCDQCDTICKTCTGHTATSCMSCSNTSSTPYFYQFSCFSQCPNGTYADSPSFTCQKCDSSCSTCAGPLNTSCTSCAGALYYNPDERVCVSSCSSPYSAVLSTRTCQVAQLVDAEILNQTLQNLIDQNLGSLSCSSNATTLQDVGSFLNNLANTVSTFDNSNLAVPNSTQQLQECSSSCNNGVCQYQPLYLDYECQCTSGWTGPTCSTSASDQAAIEAITLSIINEMSCLPLGLTIASNWSLGYLQALLTLSNSSFSTLSITQEALSVISNIVTNDYNLKTTSDVFDPVKMTMAAQVLDNCLEYVFQTDCSMESSDSQTIYNQVIQTLQELAVLNLWQKLPDSGSYCLFTTDFELYSARIYPQQLSNYTITQPNQAKIVLSDASATSTSSSTPVDIQILFWKNNLLACPAIQKQDSEPPLVSLSIYNNDSMTQAAITSNVSAQISYPVLPNQNYGNCSSSSCSLSTSKDSSGNAYYQCNCPNIANMTLGAELTHYSVLSNFFKLAMAAALLTFNYLTSWVFWILWSLLVWFILTSVAIKARIIRPFTFSAKNKRQTVEVTVKSEKGRSMPANLRSFKLRMGICKSLFYALKYGHVFTSLYLYEDGVFPRFQRLVLLYTRILSLMAFSSLFKNTSGEATLSQTLMLLFLPTITVTPINMLLKMLLISKAKSRALIEKITRNNLKLREEELKKQAKSRKVAKIKAGIGYFFFICAVVGFNYIVLVIAATTPNDQTTRWAISFLISLAQDMGTSQVFKVVLTIFLVRFIAKGRSKRVVKILRFGMDPIVVRALAMVSLQK